MRISVTTIDKFREYRDGVLNRNEEPRTTEQDLIDRITKPFFKRTVFMEWGAAFHEILEHPEKYKSDGLYINNGKKFDIETIEKALEYSYKDFPKEVRANIVYNIEGEQITISGIADQIVGATVIENKTRWSYYYSSEYYDTFQWKLYLKMFGSPVVLYQIFRMQLNKDTAELLDVTPLKFTGYKNMESDILNIISQFVSWIKSKNLQTYFKDK